jgi:hypothetical protein
MSVSCVDHVISATRFREGYDHQSTAVIALDYRRQCYLPSPPLRCSTCQVHRLWLFVTQGYKIVIFSCSQRVAACLFLFHLEATRRRGLCEIEVKTAEPWYGLTLWLGIRFKTALRFWLREAMPSFRRAR